ncbi:MAG TPA: hypothetical protein VNG53_09950, partial [Bacteroidia bacterium]|nr:hypothetical protein [Bacteroidia bacterium]
MTNCTSLFYLIIIASLFSCKNGGQQKSFANKDSILRNASMEDSVKSKSNRDSLLHRKSSNEIANDKTQNIDDSLANSIVPSKIKFNFFALRKIVLKEPFSSEEALQKLFPGHYYKLEVPYADKDTISLVAWSCPDCPKHKFFGYFSDDSLEIFPLKDSNETRIADTLQFKDDNGKRNIILS